jgi:hypothetical protein
VGDADHVQILHRRKRTAAIDRIGNRRVVIARKHDDGQRRVDHHGCRPLDQILRHTVVIERIASEDYHVRAHAARRIEHASKSRGAVAAVKPCRVIVIDVQVRTVNDNDVANGRRS